MKILDQQQGILGTLTAHDVHNRISSIGYFDSHFYLSPGGHESAALFRFARQRMENRYVENRCERAQTPAFVAPIMLPQTAR
jgi:hypothetical protein